MKKFISFASIEAFRHVIYSVNRQAEFMGMDENFETVINPNNPKPTIKFTGTVKMHGTNAGVCWDGSELWAQSRSNIITVQNDNAGFAFFVESNKDLFLNLMKKIKAEYNIPDDNTIAVYGEWCGGNIQKGVALNSLEKMFVIFKIKLATPNEEDANTWLDYDYKRINISGLEENKIKFIQQYPTYEINIDFNSPELVQNRLVELTNEVEAECPVAKAHGISGVGEGIVWSGSYEGNNYIFKVKGEKHSVTKVKKLASVDVEKVNSINEFVEYAVTENRLKQAIDVVFTSQNRDVDKKLTGEFIRWILTDVIKEEIDTLVSNGLEPKEVNGAISKKAVKWFTSIYF